MDDNIEESDYVREMREYEEQREKLLKEQEEQQREMELKLKMLEDARNERLKQNTNLAHYDEKPLHVEVQPEEPEFGETSYAQADSPLK